MTETASVRRAVLIVEDEADSRETLKELLELRGFQVQTAADGREALEVIDNLGGECICFMLLDLFMPGVDGWKVYETLQHTGKLDLSRVLITTSAPHRAPQGSAVLPKPIDLPKLYDVLDAARC